MDDMLPENTCLTPCAHAFHLDCLTDCLRVNAMCPVCRRPNLTIKQCTLIKDLQNHIEDKKKPQEQPKAKDENDPAVKREKMRKKVGSKILAIVDLIEQLRRDKPGEKIVIFIQWDKIRHSLVKAIETAMAFKPHILQGSTTARAKTLSVFQTGSEKSDQLLILSLERSASGINLTCANHCIFVHPMFGDHRYAIDTEKQAIGRVR